MCILSTSAHIRLMLKAVFLTHGIFVEFKFMGNEASKLVSQGTLELVRSYTLPFDQPNYFVIKSTLCTAMLTALRHTLA